MPMFPAWPAQAPADVPEPGVEAVSAEQQAAEQGTLRSDDSGDTRWQRAPFPTQTLGSEQPFQGLLGTPRPTMHPAGPVGTIHPTDWSFQGGELGSHGELVQTAQPPAVGGQQSWGANPKTWRAAPEPWDAGVYAGWTPDDPKGE